MKKLLLALLAFASTFAYSFNLDTLIHHFYKREEIVQDLPQDPLTASIGIIYITRNTNFYEIAPQIISAAKNQELHGIILIIDNNGGPIGTFSMMHDLIKKMSEKKPVIAWIVNEAQSGGYAIACSANYIIASRAAVIGSIGAIFEVWRYKEPKVLSNDLHAKTDVEIIKAGKFKSIFNAYSAPLTDFDREYLQDRINHFYQLFLMQVAQDRNLDLEDYKIWAEGQNFSGLEALELGLIDEIGTYFDVENKMIELLTKKFPSILFAQEINCITYGNPTETVTPDMV